MEETQEKNIITVTLSPSLDRTLVTHYLAVGYHNVTEESTRLDPAGAGVNIVRALNRLLGRGHGIILLGDDATGLAYRALISEEDFDKTVIRVTGRTRSSTIILDTGNQTETNIVEESAGITRVDVEQLVGSLKELARPEDIVVFAGPLPNESPRDTYAWLTGIVHEETGADVGIVTGGEPLSEALKAQPEFVAVTQIQAEAFFNYPVRTLEDLLGSGRRLVEQGAHSVLLEMRDGEGAVLVNPEGAWVATLPDPGEGTTSGVWDALLAGFLAAYVSRKPPLETLALGAAAAAYTAAQVGSEFGTLDEVQEYIGQIDVRAASEEETANPAAED
jgi:1-phosphofructokinase family hexose kinase